MRRSFATEVWRKRARLSGKLSLSVALFVSGWFAGCNEASEIPEAELHGKPVCEIAFEGADASGQFVWGQTQTFGLRLQNVSPVGVSTRPTGWKAVLDEQNRVVVTAPLWENEAAERNGHVEVLALNDAGERFTAALAVTAANPQPVLTFESEVITFAWGERIEVPASVSDAAYVDFETPEGWAGAYENGHIFLTAPTFGKGLKNGTVKATAWSIDRDLSAEASVEVIVFEPTDGVNLNADGRFANCYMVSAPDTRYFFNATVQGNNTTAAGIAPQTLAPVRAEMLWTTATGLIKDVSLQQGYISFTTEAISAQKQGNALIAAYDAEDNILWSWHIWATPYDPETQYCLYKNGCTIMDRNLGATSNVQGDTDAYGLYYQWGRKDPFVSSVFTVMFTETGARLDQIVANTADVDGSVAYAIAHPTTFLTESVTYSDWLNGPDASDNNLWGNPDGYDGRRGEKTIYDPCPAGWSVAPRNIAFGVYVDTDGAPLGNTNNFDFINISGEYNKGWLFVYDDQGHTTYVPGAGYLFGAWGALQSYDNFSFNWTNSPFPLSGGDYGASGYGFGKTGCSTHSYGTRGDGRSVRCVKE